MNHPSDFGLEWGEAYHLVTHLGIDPGCVNTDPNNILEYTLEAQIYYDTIMSQENLFGFNSKAGRYNFVINGLAKISPENGAKALYLMFDPADFAEKILIEGTYDDFIIEVWEDGHWVDYWKDPACPDQPLFNMNYFDITFYDRLLELATGRYNPGLITTDNPHPYHEFLLYDDDGNVMFWNDMSGRPDLSNPRLNPISKPLVDFIESLFNFPPTT